ncbi:hypothetical protein ACF2JD_20710 [Aeromonas sp. A-5]|uniref:hypothetical protein n=1 Tax=Aeromonas ichthyocola TaxID=3367746 RepID=UPI0038D82E0F
MRWICLRHFPRIIGLRQGRILFDCAAEAVSPAMLAELYGNEQPGSLDAEQAQPC